MVKTGLQPDDVTVQAGDRRLHADLVIPEGAEAIVAFAHGSGSSRFSPRNRAVARTLNGGGLATLLLDLLSLEEQRADEVTGHLRFDIGLLADRVAGAIDWLGREERTRGLRIGLFGASTGAAAALVAAANRPDAVFAVVSRGGRPDLAAESLPAVKAPVLLIVGGYDSAVIEMNRDAARQLRCENQLEIVPGAGHLFEEAGKLEEVARLARDWFVAHLKAKQARVAGTMSDER
ncbi:MAG TPA: dienelactone hydrolase family protein [Planctomycetota bacterium]|nr:dienelactone hydrolase family protein [Planctomycetota bacterium]